MIESDTITYILKEFSWIFGLMNKTNFLGPLNQKKANIITWNRMDNVDISPQIH